ncbi:unnamed protein product [Nesidiocoris tenuis]|uniref:Uncharacterized protein n=1 Tax=Nesidiocoris tenuis TaxID=355587 RepID=A0A6H5HNP8_9HEMI|nr:unnamed protein product [Nesidiocoris tenuis]
MSSGHSHPLRPDEPEEQKLLEHRVDVFIKDRGGSVEFSDSIWHAAVYGFYMPSSKPRNAASDHRRHSVPISMTIHLQPRRESLPDPQRRATLGPMLDEDDELSLVSSCSSVRSKVGEMTLSIMCLVNRMCDSVFSVEAPVTSTSSIRRGSVPADTATILIATARPQSRRCSLSSRPHLARHLRQEEESQRHDETLRIAYTLLFNNRRCVHVSHLMGAPYARAPRGLRRPTVTYPLERHSYVNRTETINNGKMNLATLCVISLSSIDCPDNVNLSLGKLNLFIHNIPSTYVKMALYFIGNIRAYVLRQDLRATSTNQAIPIEQL